MPFCFHEHMSPEDIWLHYIISSELLCPNTSSWQLLYITLTFDIFILLSPVRNARLLISFCTTKFCSSLLKFYKQRAETSAGNLEIIASSWIYWLMPHRELTWDLHQRMKISDTILKSSAESESGCFSHLDLVKSQINLLTKVQLAYLCTL